MSDIRDFKQDHFTLSTGQAIFQYPSSMSVEDYAELNEWIQLVLRKIERTAVEPPA